MISVLLQVQREKRLSKYIHTSSNLIPWPIHSPLNVFKHSITSSCCPMLLKCPSVAVLTRSERTWENSRHFATSQLVSPRNATSGDTWVAVSQATSTASSSGASIFPWRSAKREWLVMNRKGQWEGYPSRLPLCAHFHRKRDVWVRGSHLYLDNS